MKKSLTVIAVMALVILAGSTTAFAIGGGRGRNFVDSDNDGVCDNYNSSCQFVDNDNDGVCDHYNTSCQFVDDDGDGICDNYTTGTPQNGSGFRRGHCGGQGRRGR